MSLICFWERISSLFVTFLFPLSTVSYLLSVGMAKRRVNIFLPIRLQRWSGQFWLHWRRFYNCRTRFCNEDIPLGVRLNRERLIVVLIDIIDNYYTLIGGSLIIITPGGTKSNP